MARSVIDCFTRRGRNQSCGRSCGGRADAHLAAARALDGGAPSATYNIGRGQGFSVLEVLRTIGEVTGLDVTPEVVARRAGDPARVSSPRSGGSSGGWASPPRTIGPFDRAELISRPRQYGE